ncbi:MAG TPA: ABC-F family ATP-binding cassette domain-containing protein, partial [Anseongella sp.]|nr:ABC-F family ATP-binding cassette domain-containing protein [Anseongella sp.]
DSGKVSIREGIRIGFLRQQPHVDESTALAAILFPADNEVATVVREYEEAVEDPDVSAERMQALQDKMEEFHAWDYEAKVKEIISRLGIPDLGQPFGTLSGGERKRVFLAQMLLTDPDLILLDEPTNHLDLQAIEWLENYLSGKQITLIMVTHDRYFLDRVATEILELDRGKLYRYKGNYAYFLEKKTAREEVQQAEVDRARNLMRKELEWMRRQPKARGTKSKSRIEAFHELKEKASRSFKKDKLELDMQESRQGGKILECKHISKSFGNRTVVSDFSYTFKKLDRIGIVGKNGVGKSTFLNLLTGRLSPDQGEAIPGLTTAFGYFTQEAGDLDPERRVIEEVTAIAEFITLSDGSQVSASKFLEMFLFPREKQYTYVNRLSGGERKRLQLLKVLVKHPNFLILDEPTNDFDISALNVLEDFLEKFKGCLILVSHDRYFMDHLVDQLFVFEGDGHVRIFNGNYSAYRAEQEEIQENLKQQEEQAAKKKQVPAAPPAKQAAGLSQKKMSYQEKREYEALQPAIERLETEKKELISRMEAGNLDYGELQKCAERIGELNAEIDQKTFRWLELDELAK